MEVDQIETFLAIAQLGGFTRAGTRVHRSQSAISRRLRLLESELGAPVFERFPGRVQLTEVGRALLPHAEAMLAAHRDARDAVHAQLHGGASNLTLAVVGTIVDSRLCAELKRFCSAHPELHLTIKTGSSAEISQLVHRGDATFGVRYFMETHPHLTNTEIGREEMVVVAAADHPRIKRNTRSIAALAAERWLGFPSAKAYKEAFGRVLRQRLAAASMDRVEVMEVDSLAAQKNLVEAGFGLALLPKSALRAELARKTLMVVSVPALATSIPISVVHRKRLLMGVTARALHEHLVSHAVAAR
jgi:DNA-binding transcriptional LysR family regulator